MQPTTLYVEVKDGKVISRPLGLPAYVEQEFPTDEIRLANGWYPVFAIKPESFVTKFEVWDSEYFEILSDRVVWTLTKRDKTPEELDAEKIEWWKGHRIERNFRLAETDWVVLRALERNESVPAEWLTYRQELRDLTTNPDFDGTNYPVRPNA